MRKPTRFSTCFLHNSSLPGQLRNGFKYFKFWLRFRWDIQIFHKNIPSVSYCAESISPGDHTAHSHSWPWGVNCCFFKLLHRPLRDGVTKINMDSNSTIKEVPTFFIFEKSSKIKKNCWLPGVSYPGESVFSRWKF